MENFIESVERLDGKLTDIVQSIYPGDGIFGKIVDFIFYLFTCFSEETVLISLIVFVYWCYNKKMGEGLLLTIYLSNAVNGIIKDSVRRNRPFMNKEYLEAHPNVNRDVAMIDRAHLGESYSFPSGHSQNTGSFWTACYFGHKEASGTKSTILKLCPFIIIPLVMVSRVYFGVHYASDTVVGAVLGILCAVLTMKLFYRFYHKKNILFMVVYAVSLIALFFNPTPDTMKIMGMGLGGIIGFMLENKFVNFTTDVDNKKKAIRLVVGVSTLLLVRVVFKAILPSTDEGALFHTTSQTVYLWSGFIRYMIMGFYGTFLYPLIFNKFGF